MTDPDLIEARSIVKMTLSPNNHTGCNCRQEIDAGSWDSGQRVRAAFAGIKRGRILERTDGTNPALFVETMPDEIKLIIVGLGMSPPEEGADIQDAGLLWFLDTLVEAGIVVAITSASSSRFHLTRFGREIFDIVKGQPCNL